jgi:hypothetical protein
MLALVVINVWLLLSPSKAVANLLTLVDFPTSARWTLLAAAVVNAVLSMGFERWGTVLTSEVLGRLGYLWNVSGGRWKTREGKAYKAVETGLE